MLRAGFRLTIENSQRVVGEVGAWGPAESTGKSRVRYCPGGSWSSVRRLPWKPRVGTLMAHTVPPVPPAAIERYGRTARIPPAITPVPA